MQMLSNFKPQGMCCLQASKPVIAVKMAPGPVQMPGPTQVGAQANATAPAAASARNPFDDQALFDRKCRLEEDGAANALQAAQKQLMQIQQAGVQASSDQAIAQAALKAEEDDQRAAVIKKQQQVTFAQRRAEQQLKSQQQQDDRTKHMSAGPTPTLFRP